MKAVLTSALWFSCVLLLGCGGGGGGGTTSGSGGSGFSGGTEQSSPSGLVTLLANKQNTNSFASHLQSDGKLVLGGRSGLNCAVARLSTTKILDPTFNQTGLLLTSPGNYNCEISSVVSQSDGKIIALVTKDFSNYVLRFNIDGGYDQSFGQQGVYKTPFSSQSYNLLTFGKVFLDTDGKITIAGISNGNFVLAKVSADGKKDDAYGALGYIVVRTSSLGANQSQNQIVRNSEGDFLVSYVSNSFYVFRVLKSGSLDTNFGNYVAPHGGLPGMYWAQFPGQPNVGGSRLGYLTDIAPTSDGGFYALGITSFDTFVKVFELGVTKGTSSGKLDASFGSSGMLLTGIDVSGPIGRVQSNGKLLVTGVSGNAVVIYRFNTDGSMDNSFLNAKVSGVAVGGQIRDVFIQSDEKIIIVFDNFSFVRLHSNGAVE